MLLFWAPEVNYLLFQYSMYDRFKDYWALYGMLGSKNQSSLIKSHDLTRGFTIDV